MTNIYDVINELYNDDEGWNTVLERRYAEQFLRTEAFRGATDDELLEIWQQVMYLLIYCGNTSYKIGDMTGEDFVYCISWCRRNIGDFELEYDSVDCFLSVIQRLLSFLKQKKAISSDTAADKCRLKLLGADGRLLLFKKDGSLPEEYEKYRRFSEVYDLFDMANQSFYKETDQDRMMSLIAFIKLIQIISYHLVKGSVS